MNKIKYLIILIIPFLLSGCYNYKELNNLAITTGISINYDNKKDEYKVIVQVINPLKQQDATNSNKPPFINYISSASTLEEAFQEIILECPKVLYGAEVQILVLSENVVKEHISSIIDYFIRKPELRPEFKVIVARDNKALKGITIETLLNNLTSSNILSSLEKQEEIIGITASPTLNELANMYLNPNKEIILPTLIVEGSTTLGESNNNLTKTTTNTKVKLSTSSIFKENNLLGFLSLEESKSLTLIRGETKSTILKMNKDNGYVVFEPNKIKTSIKPNLKERKITLTVEGLAKINEVTSSINLNSPKEIKKLEEEINKFTKYEIEKDYINIKDKYRADVFNFKDIFYKNNYKDFIKVKDKYDKEIFPSIKLEVISKIKLYEKGNILGGVKYEKQDK